MYGGQANAPPQAGFNVGGPARYGPVAPGYGNEVPGQPGYGGAQMPGYGGGQAPAYGQQPSSPFGGATPGYGGAEAADEGYANNMSAFSSKTVRLGFIRKVYSILSVQLIITFGFILIFVLNEDSKRWAARNSGLMIAAMVVSFASLITLACCGSVRRKFPLNFFCLALFTITQSFVLGFVSAFYKTESVCLAVAMTATVCIGLTLFAMQTKIDFTPYTGVMFVAVLILMVMGMVLMFFRIPWLQTVYAAVGALIFSIYLVIDTQMIVGGSHRQQFSPEEYIFGAITLYTDIINIFMFILQLVGSGDR